MNSLSPEQCLAVYDAVTRANITRDVKTPAKKASIVHAALAQTRTMPPCPDRKTILQAIADYAYGLANDGESAPDYRWMYIYIEDAAKRYSIELTPEEVETVAAIVRSQS